jgi:hypothetical protein
LPPRHKSDKTAKQEEAENRKGTWHRSQIKQPTEVANCVLQ